MFGNLIHTARVPGMATADPAQGQPATSQQAETFDSGNGVLRTGRRKPAMVSQPWAYHHSVAFNEYQNQFAHALQFYASDYPMRRVSAGYFENLYRVWPAQPDHDCQACPGVAESSLVSSALFGFA